MEHITILSGAGLSAESGLGTFRDAGGVWSQYDLAEVATPEGYCADPGKVLHFYNARRANMRAADPNEAHRALASLSQQAGITLVTQNVVNMLERAGAVDVIHMHGELARAVQQLRCAVGRARYHGAGRYLPQLQSDRLPPRCRVVWRNALSNGTDI